MSIGRHRHWPGFYLVKQNIFHQCVDIIRSVQFSSSNETTMAKNSNKTSAKKIRKIQAKKIKKSKKKKSKILCENCGSYFSKLSNLNTHIEKVHKGLRWRCHICGKHQVSKHSHLRHYNSLHNNELPANINANQRYADTFIDMPEKAKDSIIQELKEQFKVQQVLVKSYRKKLLARLKENIDLKSRLELDCEHDKLEYNTLLGEEDAKGEDDQEEEDQEEGQEEEEEDSE